MSRTRASLLAVLIALMTSAAILALPFSPKVRVQTMTAQRGEVTRTVLLSGTVGYRHQQLCVNRQEGRISRVYVQPGQPVKKGDLLFRMDTSVQEAALAEGYAAFGAWSSGMTADGPAAALAMQQQRQFAEQEAALSLSIEAASVRAEMDGVVEAVYLEEGDAVPPMTLLGLVRGEEKCILAAGAAHDVTGLLPGAAAEAGGTALRLHSVSAPDEETGMQQLLFVPVNKELDERRTGESVTVEAAAETIPDCVPIPLSAVDRRGCIWYAEDGKARSAPASSMRRSRTHLAAPAEWEGRAVILLPDESLLSEGCAVKEARKP